MTMVNILLYFFIQFYLFLFCLLCQSAGPQAVRSQTDKYFSVMEAADASCGLDLLSLPHLCLHQLHIRKGGAAGGNPWRSL